jgi:hypothetical protein
MLTDLEAAFRSLKSELGLRPVDHQAVERTEGHLFITVVADQFVHVIPGHLQAQGIVTNRCCSLCAILASRCRVTATFRDPDGRALHVRLATRPKPAQRATIHALGSDPTLGRDGQNDCLIPHPKDWPVCSATQPCRSA